MNIGLLVVYLSTRLSVNSYVKMLVYDKITPSDRLNSISFDRSGIIFIDDVTSMLNTCRKDKCRETNHRNVV